MLAYENNMPITTHITTTIKIQTHDVANSLYIYYN